MGGMGWLNSRGRGGEVAGCNRRDSKDRGRRTSRLLKTLLFGRDLHCGFNVLWFGGLSLGP